MPELNFATHSVLAKSFIILKFLLSCIGLRFLSDLKHSVMYLHT